MERLGRGVENESERGGRSGYNRWRRLWRTVRGEQRADTGPRPVARMGEMSEER